VLAHFRGLLTCHHAPIARLQLAPRASKEESRAAFLVAIRVLTCTPKVSLPPPVYLRVLPRLAY
jgi:hypothetical protein